MVRVALARAGVFAFGFALAVPFAGYARVTDVGPASSDISSETAGVQAVARSPLRVRDLPLPEIVARVEAAPAVAEAVPIVRTPAPISALPSLEPPATSGLVVASWYGPGFYGNRTACGQTYTPEILGVAHRTLPCGTLVTLEYRGRTLTVPVIDRGPYVAGRSLDLSSAVRDLLGCPDLCTLSMRLGP